ncbi:MAG: polyphenol oxidase family protein [Bacteriovoracaceae bacterium]|nr:polyphenol oxidase family protein [Bacteriovoracaceae bacterium]
MSDILLEKKLVHGGIRVFNDRPEFKFHEVEQVHGDKLVEVSQLHKEKVADGIYYLFSSSPKLPIAIKTADCLPITIIGTEGVIHVHAGWRGVHLGIHSQVLIKTISPYYAFIGPAIQQESYEVSEDFRDNFKNLESCFISTDQGLRFNLPEAAKITLQKAFPKVEVEISSINTFTTPGHNSFRKTKTKKRNYNVFYPSALWE